MVRWQELWEQAGLDELGSKQLEAMGRPISSQPRKIVPSKILQTQSTSSMVQTSGPEQTGSREEKESGGAQPPLALERPLSHQSSLGSFKSVVLETDPFLLCCFTLHSCFQSFVNFMSLFGCNPFLADLRLVRLSQWLNVWITRPHLIRPHPHLIRPHLQSLFMCVMMERMVDDRWMDGWATE